MGFMKKLAALSLVIVTAMSLTACASSQRNMTAAALGGAGGAVLGGGVAGTTGAVLGAAGGAAAGVALSDQMYSRHLSSPRRPIMGAGFRACPFFIPPDHQVLESCSGGRADFPKRPLPQGRSGTNLGVMENDRQFRRIKKEDESMSSLRNTRLFATLGTVADALGSASAVAAAVEVRQAPRAKDLRT